MSCDSSGTTIFDLGKFEESARDIAEDRAVVSRNGVKIPVKAQSVWVQRDSNDTAATAFAERTRFENAEFAESIPDCCRFDRNGSSRQSWNKVRSDRRKLHVEFGKCANSFRASIFWKWETEPTRNVWRTWRDPTLGFFVFGFSSILVGIDRRLVAYTFRAFFRRFVLP